MARPPDSLSPAWSGEDWADLSGLKWLLDTDGAAPTYSGQSSCEPPATRPKIAGGGPAPAPAPALWLDPPDRLSRAGSPEGAGSSAPPAAAAPALPGPAAGWAPPPGCPCRNLRVRQREYRATYYLYSLVMRPPDDAREVARLVRMADTTLQVAARRMWLVWRDELAAARPRGSCRPTRSMLAPGREMSKRGPWRADLREPRELDVPPADVSQNGDHAAQAALWWQLTDAIAALRAAMRQPRGAALPPHAASLTPAQVARQLWRELAELHDDPDAGCVDPGCRAGRPAAPAREPAQEPAAVGY